MVVVRGRGSGAPITATSHPTGMENMDTLPQSYVSPLSSTSLTTAFPFASLAPHALSAQHPRLVVRLLSHSLSPLPSNSARTRPFVLTLYHFIAPKPWIGTNRTLLRGSGSPCVCPRMKSVRSSCPPHKSFNVN
jgi:hypothetical protein